MKTITIRVAASGARRLRIKHEPPGAATYTIEPGRCIYRDGEPFIEIKRDTDDPTTPPPLDPWEADRVTQRICELLNQHGLGSALDRAQLLKED